MKSISKSESFIQSIEGKLYILQLSCIGLSIMSAFIWQVTQLDLFKIASLLLLVFGYLGLFSHPFVIGYIHQKALKDFTKNPLSVLYNNAKSKGEIDNRYIQYFSTRKMTDLELVHLEVMAEKEAFEKRTALLVGAIDKVGLVPGIFALLVSIDKVKDIELDWILSIAYAMPLLYLFGAFSQIMAVKMTRHISIIDYAIEQKKV